MLLPEKTGHQLIYTHTHTPPLEVHIETAEKFPSARGLGGEEDFLPTVKEETDRAGLHLRPGFEH